jgi:rhodanese-related sulfurtransferase
MEADLDVSANELKRMLESGVRMLLLDVRQPEEHAFAHIKGDVLLPLNELPSRTGELAPHAAHPVVIYCHHGIRSLHAAEFLRAKGFADVRNLSGGIDAWSREVDPSVPRY